jgi:hypothetical protein
MKTKRILAVVTVLFLFVIVHAQEDITSEEYSEMRRTASESEIRKLLDENPVAGYFYFTEDRLHDIRLTDEIPVRWIERPANSRSNFHGDCLPGEFYTFQIAIYTPYKDLNNLSVVFSDLKNEEGEKIKASALRCFNLNGVDTKGRTFNKQLTIPKGKVQALWIGTDVPPSSNGTYKGVIAIKSLDTQPIEIDVELTVKGFPLANHGDDEGWRKSRLRWLDSSIGHDKEPTKPYTPLQLQEQTISWLGGTIQLAPSGLPLSVSTQYDQSNQIDTSMTNNILSGEITFVIETFTGKEILKPGSIKVTSRTKASIEWEVTGKSKNFDVKCIGSFGFDGLAKYSIQVNPKNNVTVKDIRLETHIRHTPLNIVWD